MDAESRIFFKQFLFITVFNSPKINVECELVLTTALQTVWKAMTHIYYGTENEGLRLSLWAARAGSSFSTPKSAVASFPHCL